jgi:S-adenosylmethionine synthetase
MSTHSFSGLFTSESVGSGHPDKVADLISDTLLDAHLAQDPHARVAIETLVKDDTVVVAGEVTSNATVDVSALVKETVRGIGYTDLGNPFHADRLQVINLIGQQSPDIAQGVGTGLEQGAGDQGLVFGFACKETPELLPLPISLAHAITRTLEKYRLSGTVDWLRPDAKSQVTVRYVRGIPVEVTDVVVSTQHAKGFNQGSLKAWVIGVLLPEALGPWHRTGINTFINPTGIFDIGGPVGDCGLTGRKIIVDSYGGYARHGGGAFSGKDASKVDRSAAYFARWVARQIVQQGLATQFDGRPGAIIERFGLRRPIYTRTTNYGHFGKTGLPWET